jgi:hypothetical protein
MLGPICYERTRDQGTLGSIAIAIVEPLGGHLFVYLIGHVGKPPRGGNAPNRHHVMDPWGSR